MISPTDTKCNVTIIIPVYGDWFTLEKCIVSLKKYLDNRHNVVLINDNGPEADKLEIEIKKIIGGLNNFRYFRNEKNLGFVKTCNKGVFELDKTNNDILLLNSDTEVTSVFLEEMIDVLYLNEKHGVVCPRSNKATILSIPFQYEGDRDSIIEKIQGCHEKLKKLLPRFSVIPTGVGFCMLIRRNLIKNFGLFDTAYGKGYNEENDFCCRINRFGYSAVMANQAFVYHFEGKSFTPNEKRTQNEKNEKILRDRYPEYFNSVGKYLSDGVHPADYFSEIICSVHPKKRILFNLYSLSGTHNGTSEYGLSLLESFTKLYGEKYEITVLANEQGDAFHKISEKYPRVFYLEKIKKINKKFDIVVMPSQFFNMGQLILMNRLALRIVFSLLDIIAWRSNYLNDDEKDFALSYALQFSDGVISISDFSKFDAMGYFSGFDLVVPAACIKTIYLGAKSGSGIKSKIEPHNFDYELLKNKEFVLLIGNHFKHKSVAKTVKSLEGLKTNLVILGLDKNELDREGIKTGEKIFCFKSGNLTSNFVEFLYANCKLLVFPSQYEGFGIPVIRALLYGKKVIVFDNCISRELASIYPDFENSFIFFDYFKDLKRIIEKEIGYDYSGNNHSIESEKICKNWEKVAQETELFISELIDKKIDTKKLVERWRLATYLEHLNYESFRRYDQYNNQSSTQPEKQLDVNSNTKAVVQHKRINLKKWGNKVKFAISTPDKFAKKYYTKTRYLFRK